MPAGDPPSSRAATVSGSDGPKSSGDPAISTRVSLEGWRRYARYWPWPRGRQRMGRRAMSAMEVAQSISRISGPRRGWQRPQGRGQQMVEEGITEASRPDDGRVTQGAGLIVSDHPATDDEGEGELGPPLEPPASPEVGSVPLTLPRVKVNITGSAGLAMAVKRPRLTEGDVAVSEQMPHFDLLQPEKADGTEESRERELAPVAGKADNEIAAAKESKPEEGALPMAGKKTDAEITLANRWLPLRYPAYPSTCRFEDFQKYNDDTKRIRELNKAGYDRTENLPTWGQESDHDTKASVEFHERDICLEAAESVVAVSSLGPGHDNTCFCSGVIIGCDEDGVGTVKILTSSGILYDDDDELRSPEQKVSVKLPNGLKQEGHVLYANIHYNIAILKVCVGSSMTTLSFGSMPRYGQRVIAMGRDSLNLFLRGGFVSTLERTVLGRTHYMFPKSAQKEGFPLICTGGPVIDENGAMVGIIVCHAPEAAMMSVSIVQICLDMWKNYSCIARPDINMNLRTVQMLPLKNKDKVRCMYNRKSGFVIDGVKYDSTPEKLGIRKGDVIDIVDEKCGSTLPELETYLLLHGLRFLRKLEGLTLTKELELKIRVHDLVQGTSTDTQLSIPVVYEMALP
uniref:Uncharacterized protein n=2 Tax=Avena sativa TaxID=4498 RepID=A0ACD5WRE0_AVESA